MTFFWLQQQVGNLMSRFFALSCGETVSRKQDTELSQLAVYLQVTDSYKEQNRTNARFCDLSPDEPRCCGA